MTMLTKNFSLEEFVHSDTAIQNQLQNELHVKFIHVVNMSHLCNNILQPIRNNFQVPVKINSGFRSYQLNKLLGGATNSQHTLGMAADINVNNLNDSVFEYIKDELMFDQLIWEKGDDYYPEWIHVSFNVMGNRNEILKYSNGEYTRL